MVQCRSHYFKIVAVLLLLSMLGGCASSGGTWGTNATIFPGWARVKTAARDAAKDPKTWVPLVSAALFAIDDFDQQTVDWATRHNPLFGNMEDAKDASDLLRDIASANWLLTALTVPSGEGATGARNRAKGIGLSLAAFALNDGITHGIKSATDRERPDRRTNSFPSKHTSSATIAATLAARNIEQANLSATQKRAWQWTGYTIAGLTGWARVEAKRHFPTDVLVGFALGHFLGAFLNDVFIDPEDQEQLSLSVDVADDRTMLVKINYRW